MGRLNPILARAPGTLVLAIALVWGAASAAQTVVDPNLQVETYGPATGIDQPTGLRFLGQDDAFVIEKNSGKVKRLQGNTLTEVLDLDVSNNSERGLLGIDVHPDFENNGYVYLYYSERSVSGDGGGSWAGNRLARFSWDGASLMKDATFNDFFVPIRLPDPPNANGPNHDGGPLSFGPDGKLYLQTGDLNRNHAEQNFASDPLVSAGAGGIHRFNDDGSIPTDNPFFGLHENKFDSLYAYGVRNGFGMAFDPETDKLWDTENGPSVWDEVNLVEAGFNSGWEVLMGPEARDPQSSDDLLNLLMESTYSDPEFSFLDTNGVTAIQFLSGSALGAAYDDAVLVGDSNLGNLYLFRLNDARDGFELSGNLADLVAEDQTEANEARFGQGFNSVTDIQIGPDGSVYVVSGTFFGNGFNGIRRISLIPEPSTFSMLLLGLLGLRLARRQPSSLTSRRAPRGR